MEISWLQILIILAAGTAGGFINAVSAAGSLVTLPAFIFSGLSPAQANATNRLAVMAQNFSSAYTFYQKGIKPDPYMFWLSLAALPGAVLGAWFSLKIPDPLFTKILSVVMIIFLVITIVNPLRNAAGSAERLSAPFKVAGLFLHVLIGIYGGFIQAGSGFFLMSGGLLLHRFDIVKTNYYKSVIMFSYTLAAFSVFLWKGNMLWLHGLLMAAGMSLGGIIGVRWSMAASEKWVRRVIVALVSGMAAYLWFLK